jgi:hypothetical protein
VETPALPTHPVNPIVRIVAEARFLKTLNIAELIPIKLKKHSRAYR